METENNSFITRKAGILPELTAESITYLKEAARWAKIISIVGFILVAMAILFGVVMLAVFHNSVPEDFEMVLMVFYPIIGVLYFFPTMLLYRFSVKSEKSIAENDSITLRESLKNLRSFFKYVAVLAIIFCGTLIFSFLAGFLFSLIFS